jgi:serine/threonine protein kinase
MDRIPTQHWARSFTRSCPNCNKSFDWTLSLCPEDGAKLEISSLPVDPIGRRYKVLSVLGEGGMGIVFKANDMQTNRVVALKMLRFDDASADDLNRFKREGTLISKLNHRNIVKVYDLSFEHGTDAMMAMEYLDGISLSTEIEMRGHLPLSDALEYAIQLCDGVQYAHSQNIIHRDLKPSNVVLVRKAADFMSVKILDFGIAKSFGGSLNDETLTKTGQLFGSPPYMSPEQVQAIPLDVRSDVYSIGCILYEMLTGIAPLAGQTAMETLMKQIYEVPISLKEASLGRVFPERLEFIVAKALAKSPDKRYQTIADLQNELLNLDAYLFNQRESGAHALPFAVKSPINIRIPKAFASLIVFVATLICWQFTQRHPKRDHSTQVTQAKSQTLMRLSAKSPTDSGSHGLIPDDYTGMSRLWISRNWLNEIANQSGMPCIYSTAPAVMHELSVHKNLTRLLLDDDKGDDSIFNYIEKLPLRCLHLRRIRVTNQGCSKLAKIRTLEELKLHRAKGVGLAGSNLNYTGLDKLTALSRLSTLSCEQTALNDRDLRFITRLQNLKSLDLTSTHVTDGFLSQLVHLPLLTDLSCRDNQIYDAGVANLSKISTLESLNLGETRITDTGVKSLTKLKLKNLCLECDQITDASIPYISQVKSLHEVDLTNCGQISPKAIKKLRQTLPLCQVKADDF